MIGRQNPPAPPARWPLVLAIAVSLAALGTLFWLRSRLLAEEANLLDYSVQVFENTDALRRPEDDAVRFSEIESIAATLRNSELVDGLLVSKQTIGDRELLLYPFYHELLHPEWRAEASTWQRLTVGPDEDPHGWIYVDLSPVNRRAVDGTMGAFGVLLVICLGVLVVRQQGKEAELSRTVSELEARKAEIIRLERLALAGQLSANIFHDIKKPVLNIKHEARAALENSGGAADASLQSIREQTDLFLQMLRDLGFEQFVRAEGEEAEYCDVGEIIQRSLSLVKYERRDVQVHVEADSPEPIPLVFAPPWRLVQLFSNLILNAFQAMDGRGELWMDIATSQNGLTVVIEDNGPGFRPEVRARAFEPFVTSRHDSGGSGLGLFICLKIVNDLGGTIRIADPRRQRGARFEIELPTKGGTSTTA